MIGRFIIILLFRENSTYGEIYIRGCLFREIESVPGQIKLIICVRVEQVKTGTGLSNWIRRESVKS